MDTPTLQPCPFCGSPKVSLDDSVGGAFVSCDLCEARGPFVEYDEVNYPASIFKSVSVAPSGDAIDPHKAARAAEAAAVAAWNRRGAWQPITTPTDDQLCQQAKDFIAANQGKEQPFFRNSELPYFLDRDSCEWHCIIALLFNAWEAGHKAGRESDSATNTWQPLPSPPAAPAT